ncbi:alpha/beta hydrolase [Algicola sagamiensis]|uniref:alpha/beta hydrolase n=1 Tax=Algicola sagamiensis TaxID=163869 RepID=UPI00036B8267|nr:alpha/beta hydrolase-fold protein [Algicola sagamiensis]
MLNCLETPKQGPAKKLIVWMHGLGDSAQGFYPVAEALQLPKSLGAHFVFPNAPERPVTINQGMIMQSWYDIPSFNADERANISDVKDSCTKIHQMLDELIEREDLQSNDVILAGFSQGAVMALYSGLRYPKPLGGILALSGYLADPASFVQEIHPANQKISIQMMHGTQDPVVPYTLGQDAFQKLSALSPDILWKKYEMGHELCVNQIKDIALWLQSKLK